MDRGDGDPSPGDHRPHPAMTHLTVQVDEPGAIHGDVDEGDRASGY